MEPSPRAERVGEIAHELRNLITAVRMGCQVVTQHLQRGDVEAAEQFLSQIRKELENGNALVERVRELA